MWQYKANKIFLERLQHDRDLLLSIQQVFAQQGIKMGFFAAIGAVKRAKVGFYDQKERSYREELIDEPAEILSCIGNASELEGDTSVHAHVTLALEDGSTRGGHLLEGTVIFACELCGVELAGEQLKRVFDTVTGLKLWET